MIFHSLFIEGNKTRGVGKSQKWGGAHVFRGTLKRKKGNYISKNGGFLHANLYIVEGHMPPVTPCLHVRGQHRMVHLPNKEALLSDNGNC